MTFAHILSADIKKLSKTSFFLIHLLVPIAVAVVFTIYTAITLYKTQALVIAYFQVIAIAFPVIAAIISSLVIDQEMDAGDGYYILSAPSRIKVLSSKLLIMICAGLFSSLLTGICFGTSLMVIRGASIVLLSQCMISSIIIWACTIFLYIFQTLLCLKFGRNPCIVTSTIEALLAGLLLTGLGEGIWCVLPMGWGVRFVEIYFTMAFGATAQMIQYINASVGIVIPIIIIETCAMSAFLYTWFRRWDGRKNLE